MSDAHFETVDVTGRDDFSEITKAKEVGDYLAESYPGHLWMVSWQGGALVVKNMAISSFYGFMIKSANCASSSELKHKAKIAGGELLERAGMVRGKWDGGFAEKLEGSDKRFFKPTVNR